MPALHDLSPPAPSPASIERHDCIFFTMDCVNQFPQVYPAYPVQFPDPFGANIRPHRRRCLFQLSFYSFYLRFLLLHAPEIQLSRFSVYRGPPVGRDRELFHRILFPSRTNASESSTAYRRFNSTDPGVGHFPGATATMPPRSALSSLEDYDSQ